MNKMHVSFNLFYLLCCAIWLAATSEGASLRPVNPKSPMTIEIGYLLPLTGSSSSTGLTAKSTLEVAKADFQRQFPSVTIQETMADTASDPATALVQVKSLAAKGIQIFIGPISSEEVLAVKPFADQNNLIIISPTATAPSLAVDDSIFRISPDDTKQSLALATLIAKRNVNAIIPIVRSDLYGREFIENFTLQFQKLGGTTASPIYYDTSAKDFTGVVNATISSANAIRQQNTNASIGVLAVSYGEIVDLFKKASASNDAILSAVPWFGTDSTAQNINIANDSAAAAFAEKTQFTASAISAYNVVSHPYLPFSQIEENLVSKILQKSTGLMKPKICPVYDALWMAGMAKLKPENSSKQELLTLSKQVVGFMGELELNSKGDREYGFYAFYRFKNGKWILNAAYRFSKYGTIEPFTDYTFDFGQKDKIIKIGLLLPLTGSNASVGQNMLSSLQRAKVDIDTVIQRYYPANSHVEYIIEDTKTDPETAYAKLVSMKNNGIEFVIGPATSAEAGRVVSYANQNGIVLLSPSSTAMSLALQDNLFRMTLNDEKHCKALAKVMKDKGISHAEIIYRNDTYGKGYTEYFKKAFTAEGGSCGDGLPYEIDTTNFQNVISQVETSVSKAIASFGAGKTAVLLIAYDEVIPFFESLSVNSVAAQVRWFGTDSLAQNSLLARSPKAVEFAVKTKLTAEAQGLESLSLVMYSSIMENDLANDLKIELKAFDVAAYDSAWFISQYQIYLDWYSAVDAAGRINNLNEFGKKSMGYLTTNYFDGNGDRSMGSIVFYQAGMKNSLLQWNKYASYIYFLTEKGPFYEESDPTSNVLSAPYLR